MSWEGFRYGFAVFLALSLPPALLYWFVVHPFAAFWRRVGLRRTRVTLLVLALGMAAALFPARRLLLGADYGARRELVLAGAALWVLGVAVQARLSKQLTRKILTGVPEVDPDDPGVLLVDGFYAWTRNPRYLVVWTITLGYALMLNYQGLWIMTALSVPVLIAVVLLEEKELRERFGEPYVEYCRKVPRFIPARPRSQ